MKKLLIIILLSSTFSLSHGFDNSIKEDSSAQVLIKNAFQNITSKFDKLPVGKTFSFKKLLKTSKKKYLNLCMIN